MRSITGENNEESLDADRSLEEKWAVMTVRSASSVGNASFSGIGLLGTARVSKEYMDSIMGAQQSSTSLLSLSSSSSPVKQLLSMDERTQHCP